MSIRPIQRLIKARPTIEGAGVHLRRGFGFGNTTDFDPFLLFEDFRYLLRRIAAAPVPIAVMFAVFAGGELFGIPGLLLGIPAAALIKILWRYFIDPWLSAQLERR